ncbi:protein ARV 2 [Ricinus communis]|uniref:protein ARV 2 n=1 Tax=Ricinus communis TaxID=3988 RepID=UPI0007729C35|nr:protein ARV 2 [Ricinus communis]XP_048233231.1 protein ARV 2 [Ricinus communis]|eukprot:XP_015572294.1 protein arv1 homolog isoform X1 [Ricinus communis]
MYRCVECGFGVKSLYVQYSPGNIRLMKCENCKAVADEYIECEFMIMLIDLILHKPKAYRHLLYNVLNQETVNLEGLIWKSAISFLLLDAYRSILLQRNVEEQVSSLSFPSLFWRSQKIFMDVFLGNLTFLCVFLLATRILLKASVRVSRTRGLLPAILVSSYFKIFLIAMMVWEFPSSVIFIIDLFVLSSNIVALKVITESDLGGCIGACFCAHAAKLLATLVPMVGSSGN